MLIGVSTKGNSLDSPLDDRFGRCENFLIYNSETKLFSVVRNSGKDQPSGAGSNAVKLLADHGTNLVLAPHLGPKALIALDAMEIEAYDFGKLNTVAEAIDSFLAGDLKRVTESKGGLRKV